MKIRSTKINGKDALVQVITKHSDGLNVVQPLDSSEQLFRLGSELIIPENQKPNPPAPHKKLKSLSEHLTDTIIPLPETETEVTAQPTHN